jgi:hypothetical protein
VPTAHLHYRKKPLFPYLLAYFQLSSPIRSWRCCEMAGAGGFEPPNAGSKDLCLTA